MPGVIATIPKFLFSANGAPMVGGSLTAYIAGSTTPTNTWQDAAMSIANTNPITLDARGECVLWLDSSVIYKFILKNASGVIQWTQDNINNAAPLRTDLSATPGAGLVGWTLAGAGTVARTVQDKLRDSASVKDFGAKGDGVTDDTAAIQAAIDSLRSLYFPAGVYVCAGVTIPNAAAGATYRGDGFSHFAAAQQTTVIAKTAGQDFIFKLSTGANNITFEKLRIDGGHKARVGIMGVPQVGFASLDTVGVYDCTEFGVCATGGLWRLTRCFFKNDKIGAQIFSDSSGTDCEFTGGTIPLILVAGGNRFVNTWINAGSVGNLKITALAGAAWTGSTAYTIGTCVTKGAAMYVCAKSGASAATGGPVGTTYGADVVDGTAAWNYIAAANGVGNANNAFDNLYIGETVTAGSLVPSILLIGTALQAVQQTQINNMFLVHAEVSHDSIMGGIYAAYTQDLVITNFTVLGMSTYATATRYTGYFLNQANNCINTVLSGGVIRGVNQNPIIHGAGSAGLQVANVRFDRNGETYAAGTQRAMLLLSGGGLRTSVTGCSFISYDANPYITEGGTPADISIDACDFNISNALGPFQSGGAAVATMRGAWRNTGDPFTLAGSMKARQVFTQKGTVACGAGAVTVPVLTLPTLAESQSYMVFLSQAGGTGASATVGAFWLYGTAGGAATLGNANTATLQNTISASGATVQFTQGAGYGATSWDWSLVRIG